MVLTGALLPGAQTGTPETVCGRARDVFRGGRMVDADRLLHDAAGLPTHELSVCDAPDLAATLGHSSFLAHDASSCACGIVRPSSDLGPSGPRASTASVCSLVST